MQFIKFLNKITFWIDVRKEISKAPIYLFQHVQKRVRIKGSKAWDLLFSVPIEVCLHVQCTKGHLVVTEIAN